MYSQGLEGPGSSMRPRVRLVHRDRVKWKTSGIGITYSRGLGALPKTYPMPSAPKQGRSAPAAATLLCVAFPIAPSMIPATMLQAKRKLTSAPPPVYRPAAAAAPRQVPAASAPAVQRKNSGIGNAPAVCRPINPQIQASHARQATAGGPAILSSHPPPSPPGATVRPGQQASVQRRQSVAAQAPPVYRPNLSPVQPKMTAPPVYLPGGWGKTLTVRGETQVAVAARGRPGSVQAMGPFGMLGLGALGAIKGAITAPVTVDRIGRVASQTTAIPDSEAPAPGRPSRTMPIGVIHRHVNPHLPQARMAFAIPGGPARSAFLPPAPPAGMFPVQTKMSWPGAAMGSLGAAAIQRTLSRVIQRTFVRAGGFTWIDKDTDKRYEQVEVQVDNRIKLSDGTKTGTFYIESTDGSWARGGMTASASSSSSSSSVDNTPVAKTSISTGTPSLSSSSQTPSINTVAAVVTPVPIAGGTAVTSITAFLKTNMRSDSNYCTALLANGDLIVSKVNGVTGAAGGMNELRAHITTNGFDTGRHVYLAQKYNTALGSNHAEMCILAAARALGQAVTQMACTGPNCPYCAAMLAHENVVSANAGVDGKSQQGWAHPYSKMFWGSQVSDRSVADQVQDLKEYLKGNGAEIGMATLASSAGKSILWI
jgi:hypothetical protein